MAHNTSTVDRDLDMFKALLTARGDLATLATIQAAQDAIHGAYETLLSVFETEIGEHESGVDHEHYHGGERSFDEIAHHDAQLARRYETR
jgi:hypothetical protein